MANANPIQQASEALAQLVASSDGEVPGADIERGLVPTSEAARVLGVSEATLLRRARELGGRRGPRGKWMFELERLRIVQGDGGPRRAPMQLAQEEREGARDAKVVAMLEQRATVSQIVMTTQVPLETVIRLRDTWIRGQRADREGIAFACECGAPSDPSTARCMRHHQRAWVLSDPQIALLRGEALPEPGTCTCRGCKATVRTEDADALCVRCAPRLTVAAPNGVLVIMLAGTPVRALSIEETRALAPQIAHHIPPPAPAAKEQST
jgi:hypothetical protein